MKEIILTKSTAVFIAAGFICTTANAQESTTTAASDGPVMLEEIVITGERSESTRQRTASSVSIFGPRDLEFFPAGGSNLDNVLRFAPNVLPGLGNSGPSIRGIETTGVLQGVDAALGGSRARTTVQIDGRPASYDEFIYGSVPLWDVQRVELFRTPQTTTNGVNSIAGAIYVFTNDPVHHFESAARAYVGNNDAYGISLMLNQPLIQDELSLRISGDWARRRSWVHIVEPADFGEDQGEYRSLNVRAKLLWEPKHLPLTQKITFQFNEQIGPQTENVAFPYEDRKNFDNTKAVMQVKSVNVISETRLEVHDAVALRNTFSWSNYSRDRRTVIGAGIAGVDGHEFNDEFILDLGKKEGRLNGLLGLSYRYTSQDESIDVTSFGLPIGFFDDEKTSFGAFGEARWKIVDDVLFTAGLRYQRDTQDRNGALGFPLEYDETFDALLPKVALTIFPERDFNFGAQVQRAYNPGGATVSFTTGLPDFFDEEYLWNYELFARWQNPSRTASVAANIFYNRFKDAQRATNTIVNGQIETVFDNAERAHSWGAEVSLEAQVSKNFRIHAEAGLLFSNIERFSISSDDIEGREFARAPHFTGTVGFVWTILDGLDLRAQGRYVSDYFSDDLNTRSTEVGEHLTADAQISYRRKNWEIFAYANNITDTFYVVQDFGGIADVGAPREVGIGFKLSF
jgi:outer membrane receptor protein involved in Fe transport